jgi:hypothetical protein
MLEHLMKHKLHFFSVSAQNWREFTYVVTYMINLLTIKYLYSVCIQPSLWFLRRFFNIASFGHKVAILYFNSLLT